MAASLAIST